MDVSGFPYKLVSLFKVSWMRALNYVYRMGDKSMSETTDITSSTIPAKRGRGRPRKGEVVAKTRGKRGVRGRPKGDAAIMNDYKARMLASPKSEAIIQKVMDTALTDSHPHQAACMKMVWDRVLPASYFEKDKFGGGKGSIEININLDPAHGSASVGKHDDYIEGEVVDE